MVKVPRGLHAQAGSGDGNTLRWGPGYRGAGAQPIRRPSVETYTGRISGVPLTGGQAQGVISNTGALTLTMGPQGLGTIWYPVQVTLSTTTGALDTSTALVYLGPLGVPVTLVATVYSGNGTAALAIPSMTPGQYLTVTWSGGHQGDVAAANTIGTMDAISTRQGLPYLYG